MILGRSSFRAPNQGGDGSPCYWTAGQGLEQRIAWSDTGTYVCVCACFHCSLRWSPCAKRCDTGATRAQLATRHADTLTQRRSSPLGIAKSVCVCVRACANKRCHASPASASTPDRLSYRLGGTRKRSGRRLGFLENGVFVFSTGFRCFVHF